MGLFCSNLLPIVRIRRSVGRSLALASLGFVLGGCSLFGSRDSAGSRISGFVRLQLHRRAGRHPQTSSCGATRTCRLTVPVRPDGKLSTPLVDELVVQGKSTIEIARDIEKVLAKYVRDPVVTVVATGFVGPYSEQIRVVGQAARPQFLPYKQKMTLLDVMIAVGGLTDFADGNGATILRTSEGNKRYSVRLKDLIKNGDISRNVEMLPGDVLIIPQGWF